MMQAPLHLQEPLAYLAGVVVGDGWLTKALGLKVADADFAGAFSAAVTAQFGIRSTPRRDECGYWKVVHYNGTGRFDCIREAPLGTRAQKRAWLRGLFDSEGNVELRQQRTTGQVSRRIAIFSTNRETLAQASSFCADLGIDTYTRTYKNSAGHKGTKPVYSVSVAGRASLCRFADLVSSSIGRKNAKLQAMASSYVPDLAASCRRGQAIGAASKVRNTMRATLPRVVLALQALPLSAGCRVYTKLPGFQTLLAYFPQRELVRLSREGAA